MMRKSAEISECGKYRWRLRRTWDDKPMVAFVMLNPSTADAEQDDPTIRRCIEYAKGWGYGDLLVVNLYPYRATKPKDLWAALNKGIDITGGERGNEELRTAAMMADIVAAWGEHATNNRQDKAMELFGDKGVWCLGKNKSGKPVHPLYQPADAKMIPFKFAERFLLGKGK